MTASTLPIAPPRPRSITFALVLITLGITLLLANMGYLAALRWRDLVALWPVLLVVAGTDLLIRPRSFALAVATQIAILVVTFVYLVSGIGPVPPAAPSEASVPRAGVSELRLTLNYGAGALELHGGSRELFTVRSSAQDVTHTVAQAGETASATLSSTSERVFSWPEPERTWDVAVPSDIPTSLSLHLGAGEFDIDLQDVQVTRATISAGAADIVVRLPRPSGDVSISISTGASSVTIIAPDGVEYSIQQSGALQSRSGFTQSRGYVDATDRVTVKVTGAMSEVTVR